MSRQQFLYLPTADPVEVKQTYNFEFLITIETV